MAVAGKLNNKQRKFCEEYVKDWNGSRAAVSAGYSESSARGIASDLLAKEHVAKEIERLRGLENEKNGITRERVMAQYAKLAFFDPVTLYDEYGNLKPISEWPEEAGPCIAGITVKELYEGRGEDRVKVGDLKEIRLRDNKGALDSIARINGWEAPKKTDNSNNTRVQHTLSPETVKAISEYMEKLL